MSVPTKWTGLLLFLTICLRAHTATGQAAPRPFFERLRRLDEQFRRFQEVTLTSLQGIAENYNVSYNVDARFQFLSDQYQNLSATLTAFQASAGDDLSSLKLWTKKLQKKTERLDLKMSALERSLEERAELDRGTPAPGESLGEQSLRISDLTRELQEHGTRLGGIAAERDEFQGGLLGLRTALESQEARMVRLEELVRGALQGDAYSTPGAHEEDGLVSNLTPQDSGPGAPLAQWGQGQRGPKTSAKLQLKHSKGRRAKEGLGVHHGPTQAPGQAQRRAEFQPHNQEEPLKLWDSPRLHLQEESMLLQPRPQEEPVELLHPQQPRPQEEPMELLDPSRPRPQKEPMEVWDPARPRPHPQEEPKELWEMPQQQQEELGDVLEFPQLPMRHKIPRHQHMLKNTGTICNVKSALTFPSASAQNYAIFKKGFSTGIHEISVCTWLRVGAGAGYVGTLLSYATEDNDNKLVLYGRNSSRRGSLDFVIGDPVYRELPMDGVLDGHWHHLCVVWSSIEGRYWHYTDRRLISTGSRFRKGYEIPAGGAVVLGQEQDTVGGGFDEAEAFVGELAGFAVWDRALSPGEVSGIATGRGLPRGTVLTLDDVEQPSGAVRLVNCHCLEDCL